MREVAQAAGVSINAVSLALNNRPGVSESTRARIRQIARQLGYRPDPVLSALVRYRQRSPGPHRGDVIAFLHGFEDGDIDRYPMLRELQEQAQEAAHRLGYRLDSFSFHAPARLETVLSTLRARGILGILLAPLPYGHVLPRIGWSGFSVVGIGWSWAGSKIPWIGVEHFGDLLHAVDAMRDLGYRRIGFALSPVQDQRDTHHYAGAFAAARLRSLTGGGAGALYGLKTWSPETYRRWLTRFRPDAVLGTGPDIYEWHHAQPPGTPPVAYADMDVTILPDGVAGIVQRHDLVAEYAIETLHGRILGGLRGELSSPFFSLVPGLWKNGDSLPARH